MADATTGMTYEEKSAFASDGLPDPRFTNEDIPALPEVKRVAKTTKKKKTHRKKKSTLKGGKVRQKRLRRT